MEIVRLKYLLVTVLLTTLIGCGGDPFWLPRAHRITIQQGNLLSERQLSEVKVGMDQNAVRSLLGAPITNTPFQTGRWDYLYTRGPASSAIEAKQLAIYFENEIVARIDSNATEQSGEVELQRNWWERLFPPAREPTGL